MMPHQVSNPEYVSLRRAAEYLDMTERSVRRYIADGNLPAFRLGPREIRIKQTDLDALLRPIPTAAS